jgi:hypothetical protein
MNEFRVTGEEVHKKRRGKKEEGGTSFPPKLKSVCPPFGHPRKQYFLSFYIREKNASGFFLSQILI